MTRSDKTRYIARVAVLSAIAAVLYLIPGIPVIPIAPFYKLDFSTLPALLAGFAMGPVAGVIVTLIKDAIGLLSSSSGGIGELADFAASGSFVLTAAFAYSFKKTKAMAAISMVAGIIVMCAVASVMNYFVLLPFFFKGMNSESMIGFLEGVEKSWSFINSAERFVLVVTAPFNILKGVVISVITLLIYKPLSPLLKAIK